MAFPCLLPMMKCAFPPNCSVANSALSPVTLASDVCYPPKQENEFIHNIFEELEIFSQRNEQRSVLMFPPLPSRLRYLIQKTVERYPSLCTFSVGEGRSRRTIVCQSELRLPSEDDSDKDDRIYEQPFGLVTGISYWKTKYNPLSGTEQTSSIDNGKPDNAIFHPWVTCESDSATQAASSLGASEESCSETTEGSLAANQDELSDSSDQMASEHNAFLQLGSSGHGQGPPTWNQPVSYFTPISWDYVPTGDACNMPVLRAPEPHMHTAHSGDYMSEIGANLKERDVVVVSAQKDYSFYEDVQFDPEAFGHILEIYCVSSALRTGDLLDAYAAFSADGLTVHWVDSARALAVFSREAAALQALSLKHPLIRARKLSDGTNKSKGKALRLAATSRANRSSTVDQSSTVETGDLQACSTVCY